MFMAKVKGNVVTTQKVEKMKGRKLLIVEPVRVSPDNNEIIGTGRSFVAVDSLGAGPDELVVITQGSSSRMTSGTSDAASPATRKTSSTASKACAAAASRSDALPPAPDSTNWSNPPETAINKEPNAAWRANSASSSGSGQPAASAR